MARRKKKRTSIRTAAGTAQEMFLDRLRALRDDPLCVLPRVDGPEAKPLAKVRQGVEKVAAGKVGFGARRDKGVVGAVAQSLPLADLESVPRLVDHKVAGRRRFYLMRGHVERGAMLGVQNHDDPVVLLMAYRSMAKKHGLHFFAEDHVVCTGDTPRPSAAWWDAVAGKEGFEWHDGRCPHEERPRVRVAFPDGPGAEVCGSCMGDISLHNRMKQRHAGPNDRQPFTVHVVADGRTLDVDRELVAAYRAGVSSEADVIRKTPTG